MRHAAQNHPFQSVEIVLLDDDDWHSPTRVQRQVEPLLNGYEMTGTSQIYYQDGTQGYLYKGDGKWLGGMAFTRSLWNRLPFEDISQGPDTRWQNALRSSSKFYDIADPALFIATIHATNTCRKNPAGSRWSKVDYRMLQDLIRA